MKNKIRRPGPLKTDGQRLWNLITTHGDQDQLERLDSEALYLACQNYQTFQDCQAPLRQAIEEQDWQQANRISRVANAAQQAALMVLKQFGGSPKWRELLNRGKTKTEQPANDPFSEFLAKRMKPTAEKN